MKKILHLNRISIRQILIFSYVSVLIFPFLLQFFLNTHFINMYRKELIRTDSYLLNDYKLTIEYYLEDIINMSSMIYGNDEYISILRNDKSKDQYEKYKEENRFQTYFQQLLYRRYIRGVYIYTQDGRYFSGNANFGFMNLNENLVDGPWLKSIVPKNKEYEFLPAHQPKQLKDGFPVFSFVRNIKDPNTGNNIALMLIDINPEIFKRTTNKNDIRLNTSLYITDKDHEIIYHSDEDILTGFLNKVYFDKISTNESDIGTGNYILEKDNNKYLVSYDKTIFTNWHIFVESPLEIVEENATNLRNLMLIVNLITLIIAIIIAIIFSSHLATPLKQLTKHMESLEKKNFRTFPTLANNHEIYLLTNGFNKMIKRIKYLLQNELQLKLLKKDAEFKALQAQINPHFLYNTLETISCMADSKNVPEISKVSLMLSNMFRYSIGFKNDLISVYYEVEHAKNYLKIMQLRFENPIQTDIQIDFNTENFYMLKLTLQPLIENALIHGFDEITKDSKIILKIYQENNCMYIKIIDNGKGMPVNMLEKLNNMLKNIDYEHIYDEWDEKSRESIGLKNIHLRYITFFGPSYGIINIQNLTPKSKIHSSGLEVTLRLPTKKQKEIQ